MKKVYALVIGVLFLLAFGQEISAGLQQETRLALIVLGKNKPVAGAKVFIDGEFRGITDKDGALKIRLRLTQRDLLPDYRTIEEGAYHGVGGGRCVCLYFQVTISIEKDGFDTYEDFLSIPYNLRILTYNVYLKP